MGEDGRVSSPSTTASPDGTPDDPYLWLEEVTGDEALTWVKERNAESLDVLTGGERFGELRDGLRAVLDADDRIPYVRRRGALLYNFWQDAEHSRGLWRRTTLESYRTGDPDWELLLDVDALAAEEDENWVWAGAAVRYPDYDRALVQLSRGGADATVVREFDLASRTWVTDGFTLPEAKSRVGWIDADTVFVGTDLGPGSQTTSGYPRVMRRWRRGQPVAEAEVVFTADETDVSAFASHDHTPGFERDFVGRSPDFHTTEEYLLRPDGTQVLARRAAGLRHRRRAQLAAGAHPLALDRGGRRARRRLAALLRLRGLPGRRPDGAGALRPHPQPLAELPRLDQEPPRPRRPHRRRHAPRGAHPRPGLGAPRAARRARSRLGRPHRRRPRPERRVLPRHRRLHAARRRSCAASWGATPTRSPRSCARRPRASTRADSRSGSSSRPRTTAPGCRTSWSGRVADTPGPDADDRLRRLRDRR